MKHIPNTERVKWHFHKWSKWTLTNQGSTQAKHCLVCGKRKLKWL